MSVVVSCAELFQVKIKPDRAPKPAANAMMYSQNSENCENAKTQPETSERIAKDAASMATDADPPRGRLVWPKACSHEENRRALEADQIVTLIRTREC
jgi:hypothetical protein